jgi:hypothetical protein
MTLIVGVFLAVVPTARAVEDIKIGGVTIKGEDAQKFYNIVGDYFGLKQDQLAVAQKLGLSPEEMPVAIMIAQKAHVDPAAVIAQRLAGKSWLEITRNYKLSPEIFYAPVKEPPSGPPYGHAYGYYKNKDKQDWNKVELKDDEVVNLVNLKVISEHYECAPEEVMKMRSSGRNFVTINKDVEVKTKEKGGKDQKADKSKEKNKGQDKAKGKSKNKDKGQGSGKSKGDGGQGKGKGKP